MGATIFTVRRPTGQGTALRRPESRFESARIDHFALVADRDATDCLSVQCGFESRPARHLKENHIEIEKLSRLRKRPHCPLDRQRFGLVLRLAPFRDGDDSSHFGSRDRYRAPRPERSSRVEPQSGGLYVDLRECRVDDRRVFLRRYVAAGGAGVFRARRAGAGTVLRADDFHGDVC